MFSTNSYPLFYLDVRSGVFSWKKFGKGNKCPGWKLNKKRRKDNWEWGEEEQEWEEEECEKN